MSKTAPEPTRYRVLTGMNYGRKRREPGAVVSDIPPESVKWLLEDGHIEPVADDVPRGNVADAKE